jgi:hypothetical protein
VLRQLTDSEDFGTPVNDNINIRHREKLKRVLSAMLALYSTSCDSMADVWTLRMRLVFVGNVWEHREGEKTVEC